MEGREFKCKDQIIYPKNLKIHHFLKLWLIFQCFSFRIFHLREYPSKKTCFLCAGTVLDFYCDYSIPYSQRNRMIQKKPITENSRSSSHRFEYIHWALAGLAHLPEKLPLVSAIRHPFVSRQEDGGTLFTAGL